MPMMKGKAGAKSLFGPFCINYGTFASNLSFGAKPLRGMGGSAHKILSSLYGQSPTVQQDRRR